MSGERDAVRQRLVLGHRAHGRRHLDEALFLRFPRLLPVVTDAVWRLSPHSRLRQAALRRIVRLGIEASNRRDHEATFMLYHPDCESIFPPQMASIGQPGAHGREHRIFWERQWRTEWGDFDYMPEEMVDFGNGLLIVGRMKGTGLGSGAAVDTDWAVLYAVSGGRAVREQVFFDRREAFAAAGLRN
jgi:ketosteroid isomerase-like protein